MKLVSHEAPARQTGGGWIHGACSAAVLFCVTTFVISSFRASLNPETAFVLFDAKRIVLVVAGAGVFWLAIRAADRHRPDWRGLARIALVAVPGLALLFALAVGWDLMIEQRQDNLVARNLRWILLWSGYFGTGLAAWLAVQYAAALAQVQAVGDPVDEARPHSAPPAGTQAPGALAETGGFWVKTGRQTVRIAHESVEWVEAEGNYARIHSRDSAQGLVRMTLAAIEAELDPADFIRIHRSALCRRSAIRGYSRRPSGAMLALLASGAEAPLGRSYAKILMEQTRGASASDGPGPDDTVSIHRPRAQPG